MRSKPSISGRAEADLASQYRWYLDNAGEAVAERSSPPSRSLPLDQLKTHPVCKKLTLSSGPLLLGGFVFGIRALLGAFSGFSGLDFAKVLFQIAQFTPGGSIFFNPSERADQGMVRFP